MAAISGKTENNASLALVTGSGAGIGKAIALRLLDSGHRVITLDRNTDATKDLFTRPSVIPFSFDLSDLEGTSAALHRLVEEHGPIRKLVLNAGVWPGGALIDMPLATFLVNIHVNLVSPFLFLQALAPAMGGAGGGAIVIIASRNAFRSSTNNAGYDASKGGVVSLMRTAAGEFAPYNIRVNAVCPGVTTTPGNADAEDPIFKLPYCQQIPMGRYGDADEIAAVTAFLLSNDASFLTGQAIIVDGGQIACQDNARTMQIRDMKI